MTIVERRIARAAGRRGPFGGLRMNTVEFGSGWGLNPLTPLGGLWQYM